MLKYNALKKSDTGMPTWDSLIPVVLHYAIQKDAWKNSELKRVVADSIDMPKELRRTMYEKSKWHLPTIEFRAGWALSCLKTAGLLDYHERGSCKVTSFGRELYKKYGNNLDKKIVESQPKFIEHKKI